VSPIVYVDAMPGIKAWAVADPQINAVAAGRVFFVTPAGFDQSPPPTWLVAMLRQIEDDEMEGPFKFPIVEFHCWGRTGELAGSLYAAVLGAVASIGPSVSAGGTVIHGAEALGGGGWLPDPETSRPRYVLTARFLTRAA